MKTKVAVVILNWNGEKFLRKFLPGVVDMSSADAQIIIADNASDDKSIDYLTKDFSEITIIQNNKNGGFAKGYNDALKQIDAQYYILLNSDVEVSENWINPIIKMMDNDPTIAACQPKILSYHNKKLFEYAGAGGGFIDKYGYPFCRGRLFSTLETDNGQYDDVQEIFWATGASMFVRSEIFHELDGFDERFFAHMEEIDFCWRAKQKGYRIMYNPLSKVYHVGGGTLPSKSSFKTYLNIRNNHIMMLKNLPKRGLLKTIVFRLLLDGFAGIKFMVDGGVSNLFAVVKAHIKFYFLIPQLLKERKSTEIKKVSKIYQGNLVSDHFLKGKKFFSQIDIKRFS